MVASVTATESGATSFHFVERALRVEGGLPRLAGNAVRAGAAGEDEARRRRSDAGPGTRLGQRERLLGRLPIRRARRFRRSVA
jgi:hypothetical protein